MPEDDRLVSKDLIWHPGERPPTKDQMSAIRNRHHYAIQPIPAGTALGHDHLMAHADRGTLLEEVERLEGVTEALRAIHTPVEVPQVGKCCKANHGISWKRWPCKEAELLGMEGRPL